MLKLFILEGLGPRQILHSHVLTSMFLQTEFEKCGRVVDVYNTGKGFAFVTFDRKEDAATAIRELDGANVCGQSIKVGTPGVMENMYNCCDLPMFSRYPNSSNTYLPR